LAYLERAPRKDPPESLPITAYILEGTEETFAGYAVLRKLVVVPTRRMDLVVTGMNRARLRAQVSRRSLWLEKILI
jgi:hypothetical protein